MDTEGRIYNQETEKLPRNSFSIMDEEEQMLRGVPEKDRLNTLINLRFKAWLSYNSLKPDVITKVKMKNAFHAGFLARELKD